MRLACILEELALRRLPSSDAVRSVERNGIAGTPEQITEKLLAGVSAGARRVIGGFADTPGTDGTELFLREVMPHLK